MNADATPSRASHWLGLNDRVCAVSGAASGIGAATAVALAEAGAAVALLDRDLAAAEPLAVRLRAGGV